MRALFLVLVLSGLSQAPLVFAEAAPVVATPVHDTPGERPSAASDGRGSSTGLCDLPHDPLSVEGATELTLNTCIRLEAGSEVNLISGKPEENGWLDFGSAYGGVFLTRWLSLQGRAKIRNIYPFKEPTPRLAPVPRLSTALLPDKYSAPDYELLQLGNPVLSPLRFTAGRGRLPFGIDQTQAPEFYQARENRALWASPANVAYLTFDNLQTSRVDIGVAGDTAATAAASSAGLTQNSFGEMPHKAERAASLRAMFDIAALEGTRMVFSGYGAELGERRIGAGLINLNGRSDYTAIEFVRRMTTPDGNTAPFEQLVRLAYISAWQKVGRWVIEIDDERLRFRRGVVDHDVSFAEQHAYLRFGFGYYKSEAGDNLQRWSLVTGVGAKL